MEKNDLEKLLKKILLIDRVVNELANGDITSFTNYQLVDISYLAGGMSGVLRESFRSFKGNPDYEQMLSRLEIIKNKLYKEAKRRDEERKWERKIREILRKYY